MKMIWIIVSLYAAVGKCNQAAEVQKATGREEHGEIEFFLQGAAMRLGYIFRAGGSALALLVMMGLPGISGAHCDTLRGPVVMDAKSALEKGDVTPVLKWAQKGEEAEIRAAFKKTLAVRTKGKEAMALADQWFFETLVRIHRAGEGATYTGLKDLPVEEIVQQADQALETGKADSLVAALNAHAAQGIQKRFEEALETRKHQNESVEAGRKAVEAYVEFTHYLEGVQAASEGTVGHHERVEAGAKQSEEHHKE